MLRVMKGNINYGTAPKQIGIYDINVEEMFFYMYLPIKMKGSNSLRIPKRLELFKSMIFDIIKDEGWHDVLYDKYIYLTAKNIYATPDNLGNRAGWHSDGFGTDDINYIWTNRHPTVFCVQGFSLSNDCTKSMQQMQLQAKKENEVTYKENTLLRLTQEHIHRTPTINKGGMRCFFKLSISTEKYNLKGNSHNYMMGYDWEMFDRSEVRNHPIHKESDYIKL